MWLVMTCVFAVSATTLCRIPWQIWQGCTGTLLHPSHVLAESQGTVLTQEDGMKRRVNIWGATAYPSTSWTSRGVFQFVHKRHFIRRYC
jgi:hypothetical protein